jgi:hypothetical protein
MEYKCKVRTDRQMSDGFCYYFDEDGYGYCMFTYNLNGRPRYDTYVSFDRITSNVFGNGSVGVHQSGWRSLPARGPKHRRMVGWFTALQKTNRL